MLFLSFPPACSRSLQSGDGVYSEADESSLRGDEKDEEREPWLTGEAGSNEVIELLTWSLFC